MVSLNFVGDIGLFKEFQIKRIDPFKEIKLPDSDYNIGNFEFIIPDKRKKFFPEVVDNYAVDYDYFKSLKLNCFNAFGMANNHCMDYGVEGIKDDIKIFEQSGISYFGVGSDDFNILIYELKGISFALIAVVKNGRSSRTAENNFGPDPYDVNRLINKIRILKNQVNHVIVFPHFGTELVDVPDPDDIKNSRLLIDNGVTAVIGHHPHIIQAIEKYREGVIAYSLGSFIYIPEREEGFKKNQSPNRDFSICLKLELDNKRIIGFRPYYYKYDDLLKIPVEFRDKIPYFEQINKLIDDPKAYHKRIRQILLKRELYIFYSRFKRSPMNTIKYYYNYLGVRHLKKLLS